MSTPTTWAATEDNIGGNKVDDRVRMFRNASGHDGEFGTVRALDRDHGWRVWVHPDGAPYGLAVRMDPDDLERIVAEVDLPDATPAPLDPSKVKAGDTVTLLVDPPDTHPAFTVAGETHSLGGPTVYLGGWRVDDLPDYVTLTDHQPAPEPEPEWKPGTTGTATLNNRVTGNSAVGLRAMRTASREGVRGFALENGLSISDDAVTYSVSDFVPDEPRPLPTRDDLARIMHDDYLPNGMPRLGRTAREELAAAVLRFLRGEVR